MTFSLFDLEVFVFDNNYSIGFCLIKNWEKEWARYLLGLNYFDREIKVHILFKEFNIYFK